MTEQDVLGVNHLVKDAGKKEQIIVRALKYDGTEHRSWSAQIHHQDTDLLVLAARFTEEIQHQLIGTIARGTTSIEYYWLSRWYNIFRFLHPNGQLQSFYCNVNIPPTFDGRVLSYIDLDIDILVAADLSYRIVDEDEFALNAARYQYPVSIQTQAYQALAELESLIKAGEFPFGDLK